MTDYGLINFGAPMPVAAITPPSYVAHVANVLNSSTDTVSANIAIGSGTNRKLIVHVTGKDYTSVNSVTFDPGGGNAQSGTQIATRGNGAYLTACWYIDIPDGVTGGTYSVQAVLSDATASVIGIEAVALEDAATGAVATSAANGGTDTEINGTITTVNPDSIIVDGVAINDSLGLTPDDGQTKRAEDDAGGFDLAMSNATLAAPTAQLYNVGWSTTAAKRWMQIAVEVAGV